MRQIILFLSFCHLIYGSAMTTTPHGGRFGDQLKLYYHAKYLAWTLDIPFLYKPFHHSDKLMLHEKETRYTSDLAKKFHKIQPAYKALKKLNSRTLYTLRFKDSRFAKVNPKNDAEFLDHMRMLIAPRGANNEITLPEDKITVAIHVRKGSAHDRPLLSRQEYTQEDILKSGDIIKPSGSYSDVLWPNKFPPDEYYIEQIKRLSELCGNSPMYLFIFTDDPNPEAIKNRYEKRINNPNIEFDSRKSNHFSSTMLDDFFSMMKFDCLIRPSSNFSAMVEEIGYCKIAIAPKRVKWVGDILVIEEVKTVVKDDSLLSLNLNIK